MSNLDRWCCYIRHIRIPRPVTSWVKVLVTLTMVITSGMGSTLFASAPTLITGTYNDGSPHYVGGGTYLVPTDSGSPSATFDNNSALVVSSSTLTIAGGLFENCGPSVWGSGDYVLDATGCTVHITGGKFTNNSGYSATRFDTTTCDISGGSFTGNSQGAVLAEGGANVLTVRGGTFTNNGDAISSYPNAAVAVYGGNYSGNVVDFFANSGYSVSAPGGIIDIYGNFIDPSTGQHMVSGQSLSLTGSGHFTGALANNSTAQSYSYDVLNDDTVSAPLARIVLHEITRATFVGVDVTTQGNWRDKYGVNGFNVIGDTSASNPHYAAGISVTPGTHNSGLWAASSLSPACLQSAASGNPNRVAGIWFQTSWTMNVNITGTHGLELYLLDQPNAGYAETITIKDAVTGAVLNTQTASNFQGGKYYIWNVTGNVNVTFTSTAGHWAVLSGIFIGGATGSKSPTQPASLVATQTSSGIGLTWTASTGATSYNVYRGTTAGAESTTPIATGIKTTSYNNTGLAPATYYYKVVAVNSYAGSFASTEASATAPPPTSTATFVKTDTTTKGTWKGVYGIDGYNVIGDTSGPNPVYPAYAAVTPGAHTSGIWSATSTDLKCLQKVATGSTDRMAGLWYQTSWSTSVNVTGTHQLALYFLDYPNAGYAETVTIKDAATGIVLDTRSVSSFQGGVYEVWTVSGNVTVTLTSTAGHWAVLSGLFFG